MALAGYGSGPWGLDSFGEWRWSKATLFTLMPEPYRVLDEENDHILEAFIDSIKTSFDYLKRKIRNLGDLRDPLKVQSAYSQVSRLTLGKRVLDPAVIEQRGLDGKVGSVLSGAFTSNFARFTSDDLGKELVISRSKVVGNNRTVSISSVVTQNTVITDPILQNDPGLIRWEIRRPPEIDPNSITFEVDAGNVEDIRSGWFITDGLGEFEVLSRTRFEKDTQGIALLTRTGNDAQIDANGRLITGSALLNPKDIGKYVLLTDSAVHFNNGRHEILDVDSTSVPAQGMIQACGGLFLVDGQTLTISDGTNPAVVFEFDNNASVGGGNVAITFTAGMTAADVRDAIITAINGVGASLLITASISSSTDVALVNDVGGPQGNVSLATTVIAPQFSISGMRGGLTEYRAVFSRLKLPGIVTNFTIPGTDVNGGVTYAQRLYGVPDNRVRVRHVASNVPGISVTAQGNTVTITFEKNVSTATAVAAAVNAHAFASTRVLATATGTGASVVLAHDWVYFDNPDSTGTVFYETRAELDPVSIYHRLHGYNTALSVSVDELDITVNLATDQYGIPTSTAAQVVAAVNANVDATALVVAGNVGAGSGVAGPTNEPLRIPYTRLVEDTHSFSWAIQPMARLVVKGPAVTRGVSEQSGVKAGLVSGLLPTFTTSEAVFTANDVGKFITIQGSVLGNDGFYKVNEVVNINTLALEANIVTENTASLVWDLRSPTLISNPTQVEVHTPSFLQYLARDFGIEILKNETESEQRRWVKNVSKWIAEKGSSFGYEHLAASGSFDVETRQLYGISIEQAQLLDPEHVYETGEERPGTTGIDGTLASQNDVFRFSSPTASFSEADVDRYIRVRSYDAVRVSDSTASSPANEITDGEVLTITNNYGTSVTFEFDSNNVTTGNNTAVSFTVGQRSSVIRDSLITAINSKQSTLGIVAKAISSDVLALEPYWAASFSLTTSTSSPHFTFLTFRPSRLYKIISVESPTTVEVEPAIYGATITLDDVVAAPPGIQDGEFFSIDDGINPVKTFEYDTNGSVTAGHIAIPVVVGDTPGIVRDKTYDVVNPYCEFLDELNFTLLKVGTDKLRLQYRTQPQFEHTIVSDSVGGAFIVEDLFEVDFQSSYTFTVPAGAALVDGDTFITNDGINPAKTFEYDLNGGGVTPGNVQIIYTGAMTDVQIRDATIAAINGTGTALDVTAVSISASTFTVYRDTEGMLSVTDNVGTSLFSVSQDPSTLSSLHWDVVRLYTDIAPHRPIFDEFNADVFTEAASEIKIIQVPAESEINDAETFTVDDDDNPPTTFEFNKSGSFAGANIEVPLTAGMTADQVRDIIITKVNSVGATLFVRAYAFGPGKVGLIRDTGGNIILSDTVDSSQFITKTATFEIDVLCNTGDSIDYAYVASVAAPVSLGLNRYRLDITGRRLVDSGNFLLSYTPEVIVDPYSWELQYLNSSEVPVLRHFLEKGPNAKAGFITAVSGASLVDGETFTISDGVHDPVTFEFDSNATVTAGNVSVPFTGGDSAATVASSIATAINNVGDELLASASAVGSTVTITLDAPAPTAVSFLTESVANTGFLAETNVWSFEIITDTPTIAYSNARLNYSCSTVFECDYCGASKMWIAIEDGPYVNAFKDRVDRIKDGTPAHVTYFTIRQQTCEVEQEQAATGTASP